MPVHLHKKDITSSPSGSTQERPAPALLGITPEALLEEDGDDDRQQAEAEQLPGAVVAQELVQPPRCLTSRRSDSICVN